LVLAALGMIVLLMMAGLGVDVGYLKYQKQQMQKAADAGALAAASALITYGNLAGQLQILAAGQGDAEANGFKNGENGISVVVNNPPKTANDPFVGDTNYVEVIVSQARPTFFMKLAGYNTINVSSRAVATSVGSGSGCLYSLAPSGTTFSLAISSNGQTAQLSSNCGIMVASNSGSALNIANGDSMNTTANIGVVGECNGSDCQTLKTDGELTQSIAPFSDPLANRPAPTVPQCTHPFTYVVSGPQNNSLSPGGYCGGISIQYSGPVTFSPGTYYLEGGGLQVFGTPALNGNGVTFYNTNGPGGYQPINIAGTPSGTLAAPTSGDLAGILFFQDRSIPYSPSNASYINGTGGAIYTGTLYFPTTGLTYNGAKVTDPYELIIAWQLTFLGNTTITNHYSSLPNGASPIANAVLVE